MKRIIGLVLVSLFFVGCTENVIQPEDYTMFEKRTPVVKSDTVRGRVPWQRVLECLNLTREQRISVDSLIRIEKLCSVECKKEFNKSIKQLREEHRANMEKYRGVSRTPEVRKEMSAIIEEFRRKQKELQDEYIQKREQCKTDMFTYIEGIFNTEQLIKWVVWKEYGTIECNTKP